MRLIERLQQYLEYSKISAYAFERACQVSNGYLGKQLKGKGAVGSDILERIKSNYTDLSLIWLVTGRGNMILSPAENSNQQKISELNEEQHIYFTSKDEVIHLLHKLVARLESSLQDKDKIIALLEIELRQLSVHKKIR